MIGKERKMAIVLTSIAGFVVVLSILSPWYTQVRLSESVFGGTIRDYDVFYLEYYSPSWDSYYLQRYTVGFSDMHDVMDWEMAGILAWLFFGILFVWACLRESRFYTTIFAGLVLILSLSIALYFPFGVTSALDLNSFVGTSATAYGDDLEYYPSLGWYLILMAALVQVLAAAVVLMSLYMKKAKPTEDEGKESLPEAREV